MALEYIILGQNSFREQENLPCCFSTLLQQSKFLGDILNFKQIILKFDIQYNKFQYNTNNKSY